MKEKRSRRPLWLALTAIIVVLFIAATFASPKPSVERIEQPLKAEAFLTPAQEAPQQ